MRHAPGRTPIRLGSSITKTGPGNFVWRKVTSVSRTSAGEIKNGASAEEAVLRTQPRHERGRFVDLSKAAHRDFREHVINVRLRHLLENVGRDHGGRDAVHQHIAG